MTTGERDLFNRFIRTLEGISDELKGIRKCFEKTAGDGGKNSVVTEHSKENQNVHREE